MNMMAWMKDARVPLGMLLVQAITTGLQILSRVVLDQGTFVFALITYRHVVAAFAIVPFAICFERSALRKLTFTTFFWIFMVALTGISMAMGLFYYGLKDTSATYATNFLNLIPIVTFIFSTIFRIEKLGLRTKAGKIKTLGAILCLAGALTITLYKGKSFHIGHYYKHVDSMTSAANQNKTRGTISLIGSCLSYGLWFIVQVKLYKVFPYKYWSTFLVCIVGGVQTGVIGFCLDREPSSWRLDWNLQLVTIIYSGMLATAATFSLISWAIAQKGPTYPSMFNPLALILIAILEALFLGQMITLGSLIGVALIVAGLYSFLWGKSKAISTATVSHKGDKVEGVDSGDIEEALAREFEGSKTLEKA